MTRTAGKTAPKGEVSSERLLAVAAHLFRERGYLATSVREIAKAAGMKSGSIYYHYPSKETMLEAVMTRAILALSEAVTQTLERLPPAAGFRDRLRAAVATHLKTIHDYGDFALASREALGQISPDSREAHLRLRKEYGKLWRKIFEDAKKSGEIRADLDVVPVQMFILGALNWSSEWLDAERRSFQRASDLLADMVVDGVLARAAPPAKKLRAP